MNDIDLTKIPNEEHLSALFISELKKSFERNGRKCIDIINENECGFDVLPSLKQENTNSEPFKESGDI